MAATRISLAAACALASAASFSNAFAAPNVVTDIAAVHSIASAVMTGVGEPTLILQPGTSPHGYAMKPSEAEALAGADLIFWIGHGLTPWLEQAIETIGADAKAVAMMDAKGMRLLEFREGATFEAHDHGDHEQDHAAKDDHAGHDHDDHDHGEHKHDDHDHAESKHDDHDHAGHKHGDHDHDEHKHDEHAHGDDGHDDHAHGAGEKDPHVWLDPANGRAMAAAIGAVLTEADPANAALYAANVAAFSAKMESLEAELAPKLAPISGEPFVVFHDAYHYFEARFDVEAVGAISVSDAASPGPARIEEVRALIETAGAACVFSEPQFNASLVDRLTEGTGAKTGVLDPHGVDAEIGVGLYPALIRGLADDLIACLDADPA
ncbi:MAG: zinc ABC transporter substrate-binding protein [Pseudomonadota bacterium]